MKPARPRLYLVDAHAYLHRAYHALPPLNNSKGEPVGALYGFARMLLQLLKREKPDRVAVCFDHPAPTFRHKVYAAYKATRKEIDGDLLKQLALSGEMARAMGFSCVELPGYEADDLMATMARRAGKEGFDAVLVTGDKDALQMVGPGIRVLRDVTNSVWMDPPQVEAKFGVPPAQIVDYLAIVGDSTDNVTGVKGIGPVGAAKLLKTYGDLPAAIKAAKKGDPELPPKAAKALVESEKEALAAREIITLMDDAPIDLKPSECSLPQPQAQVLVPMFQRLEFGSLLKEILPGREESAVPVAAALPTVETKNVESGTASSKEVAFEELAGTLKKAKTIVIAALKSHGNLVDGSVAHVAVGLPDGRTALMDQAQVKKAAAVLSGPALKAVYGAKEAWGALEALGLEYSGPWFDAWLAGYCLNPVRPKAEPPSDDWRQNLILRAAKASGVEDLRSRMKDAGVLKLFETVEMPLVPILHRMEKDGIALDVPYLKRLFAEFEKDIAALQAEIDKLAGGPINVNSPKQLAELLFDKLGLQVVRKTPTGGRSTDEDCLKVLGAFHPIPAKVLEFRELSKLKSTYIEGLLERCDPKTGRVHTRFDQAGAETGRLSSVNPNLQNIPIRSASGQRIRRAFVAPKGTVLVSADYSQIDLRVLAHVSKDPVLCDSFLKKEDIHLRTACEVFRVAPAEVDKEMRRRAKAVNFGIVYGQSAFGLSGELGIPQKESAAIIQKYFERYQGVSRWIEANLEAARRDGYVRTFLGRIRYLPELAAKNTALRQFGERAARNTPIQGGSADIIKVAMLEIEKGTNRFGARMLLQIHDELLFEVPQAALREFVPWVRRAMEDCVRLSVPLVVDVKAGPNWQDMEPVSSQEPALAGRRKGA